MAGERPGAWFGFGFCGFGQALGSGRGRQVLSPEPLRVPDADADDICAVSAAWSYTAFLSSAGRLLLSGSAGGAAEGCRDAWASETLLAVLRDGDRGSEPGAGAELQAWAPGAALRGEPLWAQAAARGDEAGARAGPLPLLPGARAHLSPRPPLRRPLAPGLRARRLELGAEHALLLDEAGRLLSWGGGRLGQLGHGALEPEPAPRPLEALLGLRVAAVAAGGWHSVCLSAPALTEDASGVKGPSGPEDAADAAPFIAVQPFPALLDLPAGSEAAAASCGSRHTAVVTRTGELYTWGWGKYGQLGHGDTASWDRPRRVESFVGQRLRVTAVHCGPWNTYVRAEGPGQPEGS